MSYKETQYHHLAAQITTIEILSDLLKTTSPNELPQALVEHIRELSGAIAVYLLVHPDQPQQNHIIYVSPPRRLTMISNDELESYCLFSEHQSQPETSENVYRYALLANASMVGTLVLYNPPEKNRKTEIDLLFKPLLPLIGSALKNALSHNRIEEQAKKLATQILEREALHQLIIQTAMDGFIICDFDCKIIEANLTYCEMSQYSEDELKQKYIGDIEAQDDSEAIQERRARIIASGQERFETIHRRKDGTDFNVEVSIQFREEAKSYFVIFVQDISKRKQAEEALKRSLKDKETLINELNHRTKNTLQIIASLLTLQSHRYPKNEELHTVVKSTDARIQAISLVHQMLYTGKNLSEINMRNYLETLGGLIQQSYQIEGLEVVMHFEVDTINFLLDEAIPLGLIFNELATNSLKHAFIDRKQGTIHVRLSHLKDKTYLFTYQDNGKGCLDMESFHNSTSIGNKLIYNIGEHQLAGKISISCDGGFKCSLEFTCGAYKARV